MGHGETTVRGVAPFKSRSGFHRFVSCGVVENRLNRIVLSKGISSNRPLPQLASTAGYNACVRARKLGRPGGAPWALGKHFKLVVVSVTEMEPCSYLVKHHRWFHSWSWIDFALLAVTVLIIIAFVI